MAKQETIKPIKRHEGLVSYSREHHEGLLLAWKIRTGIRKSIAPERIAGYVTWFFEQDLKGHFNDEEQYLAPLLPSEDPLMARMLDEHRHLRALISTLQQPAITYAVLTQFADALEQHIRFEERTLFNYLQEHLNADQLSGLEKLERQKAPGQCTAWQDIFWM